MIRLLIFLYDGRCWLRQYTQPLQHFTSHLGIVLLPSICLFCFLNLVESVLQLDFRC